MSPRSAPSSLADVRLERLRRLKELQAQKAARDTEETQSIALRFSMPGDLAKLIDPTTVQTPALKLLDQNLLEIAEGISERLIFSLPPQEGKSQRCSRFFPLWMLLRDPELRIVIASYELGVARRWSRAIRNDIADHPELGLKLREDTAAAHEWQLLGHRGGLYAVGVGGGLTGRPADCVPGTTRVSTIDGLIAIADLICMPEPPLVLSWNHHESRAQWRRIEAARALPRRQLVEIHTSAGRVLQCTPDHRIYVTGRGYVAADELRAGDRLQVAHEVPWMWSGVPEVPNSRNSGPDVLHEGLSQRRREASPYHLPRMPHRVRPTGIRSPEGCEERLGKSLLLEAVPTRRNKSGQPASLRDLRHGDRESPQAVLLDGVFGSFPQCADHDAMLPLRRIFPDPVVRTREENATRVPVVLLRRVLQNRINSTWRLLRGLRQAYSKSKRTALLFSRMRGIGVQCPPGKWLGWLSIAAASMSLVSNRVPAEIVADDLLYSGLRQLGSFSEDDRQGQLEVSRWQQLRGLVQEDASADHGAGLRTLRGMQTGSQAIHKSAARKASRTQFTASSSHRRAASEQSSREPDHALQDVPCDTPQVSYDTVSVVQPVRGPGVAVYDIQVEGNHNYFAEEICLSNCLIIDDPTKGRAEADSEAYQENSWEWWTETARTRLAPHAPVIVVQTRWHELDLAGRLIEQDNSWRNINIPAQCDAGVDDPLGREEGEYLTSARGRTPEEWQQIQREVGARAWNALYQGRPAPAEGGMFKRVWWQYDNSPVSYRKSDGTMHAQGMDVVIQSWDMTFKNTDGTDFVVGQVWGRAGATAHLLDQVRARMDFPQTCKAVEDLSKLWPQATLKLIEDKANGPAVIAQLRKKVAGMVPVNPEGNKQARASAVAPFVEAGNVYVPPTARAPWIGAFLEETAGFPTSAHDDQVDAMSQALSRLMLMPSSTAFLDQLVNEQGRGEVRAELSV